MKKLVSSIVTAILIAVSWNVFAAEDSVIFSAETFVAPYADNVLAVSPIITNNNEFYEAIKVTLSYEEILPAGCDCQVRAVIEEEVAPGIWQPLGPQFEAINASLNAATRILQVSPDINFNPGGDIFIDVGDGVRISHTQGNVPGKLRVVVFNKDVGTSVIQSLTLTGYVKLYN